jgi:phage gp36-like protein
VTYCSQQDLVERYGEDRLVQLTDRENRPATTVNVTTVLRHIGDATSTINSYLGKRYQLPLATVPDVLVKLAVDISWYYLQGDTADKDSAERLAYRDAIAWLEAVAGGKVIIEGAGEIIAQAGGGQVMTKGPDRAFTRDSLAGY